MASYSGGLAPPTNVQAFDSLEDLIIKVNEHAAPQGYAVVFGRTKKFKLGERRKAWLVCDRGRKSHESSGQKRRHIGSRRIECLFFCTARRENDSGIWYLEVVDPTHNHEATLSGAHSVHRKIAMTSRLQSDISNVLKVQIRSSQIFFSIRVFSNPDAEGEDEKFFNIFKARDIYNLKTTMRRETLRPLTPVQTLLHQLREKKWACKIQKNEEDKITHLFFMAKASQKILKKNHEVLTMDCIYKTNRYKMPFLIISGQTALNTNFYVAFCFLHQEKSADYL